MQAAVLSSASEAEASLFLVLAADGRLRAVPEAQAFLRRLAVMIGSRGRLSEVEAVIGWLSRTRLEPAIQFPLMVSLGEGLRRAGSSLSAADPGNSLQPAYVAALAISSDESAPEGIRTWAFGALGFSSFRSGEIGDLLLLMLGPGQSKECNRQRLGHCSNCATLASPPASWLDGRCSAPPSAGRP